MTQRTSVLFMTNPELSQSAVNLAVAAELADGSALDVHFATFAALDANLVPPGVTFHVIPGRTVKEIVLAKGLDFMPKHPPGVQGALQAYDEALLYVLAPYDQDEYFAIFDHCVKLIQRLSPAVVVLDPIFCPGVDAARFLGKRQVILSPGTFKDHSLHLQPRLQFLWKYPVACSGFPTPLPLSAISTNIYLLYQLLRRSYFHPSVTSLVKARHARGIPGNLPSKYNFLDSNVLYAVPSVRDTEFPLEYIPPNLVGCGPILQPFEPLDSADRGLARWLQARPTIIVNMGSHLRYGPKQAAEVLAALESFLEHHPDKQVLWKCPGAGKEAAPHQSPHVRVVSWLPSTPTACLTTSPSTILAYVHHGGSNSFHEAIAAGVPQVVCPVWTDTYDFASRVELLGIGVRGNASAAPDVRAEELACAMGRIAGDSMEAKGMRNKARLLSKIVGGPDNGRKIAADHVRGLLFDIESQVLLSS
ncbi:2-hydroxyacylsphingosine 1-beta-galactosyltransferase [Seiridium cupressi]